MQNLSNLAINLDNYRPKTAAFHVFEYGKKIRKICKQFLSLSEKLILWEISDHFGKNGKMIPSNAALAIATGMPVKTVMNKLSELKRKKFLYYDSQFNRRKRYIRLYCPETAAYNLAFKIDDYGPLLVPRLSLVRDTTIPNQGDSLIRKEQEKRTTTTPKPPLDPEIKPPEKDPPNLSVVGSLFDDLKNRIADPVLQENFSRRTYVRLKNEKLSDGQIKTLIDEMNAHADIKSCGWMFGRDPQTIPDFDEMQRKKAEADEAARKILAEREKITIENDQKNLEDMIKTNSPIIEEYRKMPIGDQQKIYSKIIDKCMFPEMKQRMIDLGLERFHEAPGAVYKIKKMIEKGIF